MTAYGTRRHLYDPKMQTDKPSDHGQSEDGLQQRSQPGEDVSARHQKRHLPSEANWQPVDNLIFLYRWATKKVTSQKRISVNELGRRVYDPKYRAAPSEPVIHNRSQGTGTNELQISDSDYWKNAQMSSMASTKRTTPEITSVMTKAMMVRFSERSSVLAHCFYSVRPKLNLNLSNFYLVFLKHYYAYCT